MARSNFIVRGGANFSGIQQALSNTQRQLQNFQNNVSGTMKKIGAILGSLAVGKLIKDSTQAAMSVESAIDNINRNMGNNAKVFQNWVNTQSKALGMAKADAYKYGSTFSNLLSSFTTGTKETAEHTQELMKAAAIISSKTGRTYDDTANRIRSGMLGSTEAIEDLGVYTNISMLESTEAFKKFAGNKSWSQLSFQTQQQIRLAAILEQTYKRYGDTIADTTQTRQAMLIASLKNIQLSLGQAFLPIYNAVLPALTAMADAIGRVVSVMAQFSQALFGKAKVQAKETQQQANAMSDLGDETEKAGKKAKSAVAGFDEINSLNDSSGGSGTEIAGLDLADQETEGGFADSAVEVSAKVEEMANKIKEAGDKIKSVFGEIADFVNTNKIIVTSAIGGIVGAFAAFEIITHWASIVKSFTGVWNLLVGALTGISAPVLAVSALIGLLVGNIIYMWKTNEGFRNSVIEVWNKIKSVMTTIATDTWTIVKGIWDRYGQTLINNLAGFMYSIQTIIQSVWESYIKPIIMGALNMITWLWTEHLRGLVEQIGIFIMTLINGALEIWNGFIAPIIKYLIEHLYPVFADVIKLIIDMLGSALAVVIDVSKGFLKALGGVIDFIVGVFTGNWKKAWEGIKAVFSGIVDGIVGVFKGGINLIIDLVNYLIRQLNKISFSIPEWVPGIGGKSWGISIPDIPKLATGAITDVNNPFLAVVGDNKTQREVISPLDDLLGMITSAVGTAMMASNQFNGNNKNSGDIIFQIDGTTIARVLNPYSEKESQRIGSPMIVAT